MTTRPGFLGRQLLVWFNLGCVLGAGDPGENWGSFRGPGASGMSQQNAPLNWDVERSQNVKWKTPIPGLGHSSPIVWNDRIFITTAVSPERQSVKTGVYGEIEPVVENGRFEWKILCLDKNRGSVLWERTAAEGSPKVKRHPKSSHANCTPVTDGSHVVAFFGSEGLYCFDLQGKPLWHKDLGLLDSGFYVVPEAQWEFGSSPVIAENKVIVQCDVESNSFVAAFDVADGHELWRTPRDEVPTWCTPTVYRDGRRTQVICNGHKHAAAYDLQTGKELWTTRVPGDIPVPTPVVAGDLIFLTSSHGGPSAIYAIRTTAVGDISPLPGQLSSPGVAWSVMHGGSYMQTPLVLGELLYCCNWNGVLNCFEASSGNLVYQTRLPNSEAGFTASPVALGDKIYLVGEQGDVHIIQAGRQFKEVAQNRLGAKCLATPAVGDGVLLFRTETDLIAIGTGAG